MNRRACGILLHPTSLPGPYGIGTLGDAAYRFVDFLAATGQTVWQILPLGPTGYGDSPYSAYSAFAGNPLLVCPDRLVSCGDLAPGEVAGIRRPEGRVDYGFAHDFMEKILHLAALRFAREAEAERRAAYERFSAEQAYWLNDYALFRALRRHFGHRAWNEWPLPIRRREEQALRHWGEELAEAIAFHKYTQFVFFEQWFAIKGYAAERGIRIMGDIPIFVAFDSADVWANPDLFYLDEEENPTLVAGVPPDYFSATGQRWGNPLYRWERMAERDYSWWTARFRWNLTLADLVRIDHFRGFEACWAVPAAEKTAINGEWMAVPGAELFAALQEKEGTLPVVAEDLGLITPEVEALRDRFGFPGMKVLQFAFGSGADNPYLPCNLTPHCVIYTGTHDNNTTLGWWRELGREEKESLRAYLGTPARDMPWPLIRLALASVAELCILPLQDVLALGGEARMNTPGAADNNWQWRFLPEALSAEPAQKLAELTRIYGRHT